MVRSYTRQRDNLIKSAGSHIRRMQKALEQMNIQLHKVITDITGVTSMRIIEAILDGERDPIKLAQLKHRNARSSHETIAKSLEGEESRTVDRKRWPAEPPVPFGWPLKPLERVIQLWEATTEE